MDTLPGILARRQSLALCLIWSLIGMFGFPPPIVDSDSEALGDQGNHELLTLLPLLGVSTTCAHLPVPYRAGL